MRLLACLFLVAVVGVTCVAGSGYPQTPKVDASAHGAVPVGVGDIFNRF